MHNAQCTIHHRMMHVSLWPTGRVLHHVPFGLVVLRLRVWARVSPGKPALAHFLLSLIKLFHNLIPSLQPTNSSLNFSMSKHHAVQSPSSNISQQCRIGLLSMRGSKFMRAELGPSVRKHKLMFYHGQPQLQTVCGYCTCSFSVV
jgi:hypothetical protein